MTFFRTVKVSHESKPLRLVPKLGHRNNVSKYLLFKGDKNQNRIIIRGNPRFTLLVNPFIKVTKSMERAVDLWQVPPLLDYSANVWLQGFRKRKLSSVALTSSTHHVILNGGWTDSENSPSPYDKKKKKRLRNVNNTWMSFVEHRALHQQR